MAKKTWIKKRDDCSKVAKIKIIDKKFADIPEGSKMFIGTAKIVNEYVKCIPYGEVSDIKTMRNDLAIEHQADKTCPVTAGIFLRIVSEAAFEEFLTGKNLQEITPFWRIISPEMKIASKLTCGIDFIKEQKSNEGF